MKKFLTFFFLIQMIAIRAFEINGISKEDKDRLEIFYKFLITHSSLGYTLCGNKPCSMHTFPHLSRFPLDYSVKIFFKYPGYSIICKGWETWTKYSDNFHSKNFVFIKTLKSNNLILINKNAIRKVIEDNLDLFQKYSKLNFSINEFLNEICSSKIDTVVKSNTALLGILLGYGKNNSLAFSQKSYVQNLNFFEMNNAHLPLNEIINVGFISIQNGTNEIENKKIKNELLETKKRIKIKFMGSESYLQTFLSIYTQN